MSLLVHMSPLEIRFMAGIVYLAVIKDALVSWYMYYCYKDEGMDF